MNGPLVTAGIALYRSKPFLDSLQANCEALAGEDRVEVIVSDRHGFDDTIDLLEAEWCHDPRFRFLKADDRLNWVEHMNLLLARARGDYFRWMPHDDTFPAGCLEPLIGRLERDPQIVLAYGPTRALDASGSRIPDRDRLHTCPIRPGEPWTFRDSLEFFWRGSCDGAFKGLFRRRDVVQTGLFIRPTRELVHAERAWLFGVSLLGGLGEEPTSIYLKRYHESSAHAHWRPDRRHILSATATMCGYLRDFGRGTTRKCLGMGYLWTKAIRRMRQSEHR